MTGFRGHLAVTVTGGLRETMTPWAGVSALAEAYRRYGVGDAADRALPKKKTAKGLSQGQMTESFVLLSALGGECIEDIERLRQDKGLEAMLGYQIPAAETARQWLDKFHDENPAHIASNYRIPPLQGAMLKESTVYGSVCSIDIVCYNNNKAYYFENKRGSYENRH